MMECLACNRQWIERKSKIWAKEQNKIWLIWTYMIVMRIFQVGANNGLFHRVAKNIFQGGNSSEISF